MTLGATTRDRLLAAIGSQVPHAARDVVIVAVDGCDGAGKSWFAAEPAAVLGSDGRSVIRASVDNFHNPRALRYRRGADSAEGYWLDAFDYPARRANLLDPLSPGGTRKYLAVHDLVSDRAIDGEWLMAPAGTVLVLDGMFLHRDELVGYWIYSVFLDVEERVRLARMLERDGHQPRTQRYVKAQQHYLASCNPAARASVVIDNNNLIQPLIISAL